MAQNPRKVITDPNEDIRLGYVHLLESYALDPKNDPKFTCMVIVPKTAKKTIARLKAAQEAAKKEGLQVFGGSIPKNLQTTIHDGDEEADLERNPELEGSYYFNVSSKRRPGVVDRNVQPILDSTEVYSGMYARVSLTAYAYSYKGKKGVTFGLENVQKIRDGEVLGGGATRAEDDFDALDGDEDGLL